jgi:hypothetical protein
MDYAGDDGSGDLEWGYGVSSTGGFWFLSPSIGWATTVPMSFDVIGTDFGDSIPFYAAPDLNGISRVRVASTGAWRVADLMLRDCP